MDRRQAPDRRWPRMTVRWRRAVSRVAGPGWTALLAAVPGFFTGWVAVHAVPLPMWWLAVVVGSFAVVGAALGFSDRRHEVREVEVGARWVRLVSAARTLTLDAGGLTAVRVVHARRTTTLSLEFSGESVIVVGRPDPSLASALRRVLPEAPIEEWGDS